MVLFVGRLTERKGCEFLIRAIKEVLRKDLNTKIICKIVGEGVLKEDRKIDKRVKT